MPRATVSTVPKRYELKSCPGGYVVLKRMSHGQRLHRQDMAVAMSMEADQKAKTASMSVQPTQTAVAAYEFKTCIVEHNLEDDNGQLMNFSNSQVLQILDGAIGDEIGTYIDDIHGWEADLPNSEARSEASSGNQIEAPRSTQSGQPYPPSVQ